MLPANRKIKLLAAKLSSLKTELSLSREIFTSASKEVEKLFYEKHPETLATPKASNHQDQESETKEETTDIKKRSKNTNRKDTTTEQNTKNETKEQNESAKTKDPEIKKLFKKIASKIHPDKISLLNKEEREEKQKMFKKAVLAMEEEDMIILADIALKLGIDTPEVPKQKIKIAESKIKDIKKQISMLESSLVWEWFFTENQEKKEITLKRLFEIIYEKNFRT